MRTSQQELAAHNLRRVREYFATHICATQRECAAALRLSVMEINQHVEQIRREWKLKGEHHDVFGATGVTKDVTSPPAFAKSAAKSGW